MLIYDAYDVPFFPPHNVLAEEYIKISTRRLRVSAPHELATRFPNWGR